MVYWGKYVAHDNNRDGIGKGLKLTQNMLKSFLDLHPTGVARPARVGHAALRLDRHRPVQPDRRSDPGQRVVAARAERDHGDDQARRAGRVDLQLLRRLGPELHVLDRRHAQLDRPVLRDAERRRATRRSPAATSREWYRPNPTRATCSGAARQRQHAAVGAAHRAEQRREEQGELPRELLREEQEQDRARQDARALRLRRPRGAAAESKPPS